MEMVICQEGTVLMAILVNMAMGEVNGIKEHTIIGRLSTSPLQSAVITTIKAMMKRKVIGMMAVLMSSSFETVDPTAPYRKA
jgi:hypothetical protein